MADFREEIAKLLSPLVPLGKEKLAALLQPPPSPEMGDYAFPCFSLAGAMKKNPAEIALELQQQLKPTRHVTKVEAAGSYLNFFVNRAAAAEAVLAAILKEKTAYGLQKAGGKTVMVEYFHANTHKAVHVGHIRNICLGEALCRILEAAGSKVVRVNYQGDVGPHVAKCLWGYQHTKEKPPARQRGVWLGQLYTAANRKMESDENAVEESKQMLQKIYDGDKKLVALWQKTRTWCLDDFNRMYPDFGVKYDRFFFESEMEMPARDIARELLEKGVAQLSDGAIILDLTPYNLGIFVILTRDGRALYSSKDLVLARYKFSHYKLDRSIHVVGKEQELHFRQLFKSLELMGMGEAAKKSYHLIYGLVMLPEGKMSSREGTVVLYEDLREKLQKLATAEVEKRHRDWSGKKVAAVAKSIAFAALKFTMLNRDNNKIIIFDWDQALDFEGETGPYVLYAHSRICSVFRKHGRKPSFAAEISYDKLAATEELELIKLLESFPAVVEDASRQLKPLLVVRFLLSVSQRFNEFYHLHPVLNADVQTKKARLALLAAVKQVMENALGMLAIDAPGEM